ITDQFPDVQQLLKNNLEGTALILEGEAVPVDQSTGELLPFQLISQRRGRKYDIEGTIKDIPVAFYTFDLLHADEIDYTDRPYLERRERLRRLIRKNERLDLARQKICNDPVQLDEFMQDAVADGCEGLMIKSIDPFSTYKAGARGWTWIKYKREYKSEMQDSVDLAVVGAFAGRGRRGGAYGALLLAAYDKSNDVFRTVCKCGSGVTDKDWDELPKLLEISISIPRPCASRNGPREIRILPSRVQDKSCARMVSRLDNTNSFRGSYRTAYQDLSG